MINLFSISALDILKDNWLIVEQNGYKELQWHHK